VLRLGVQDMRRLHALLFWAGCCHVLTTYYAIERIKDKEDVDINPSLLRNLGRYFHS
jgi:hypothetical protein